MTVKHDYSYIKPLFVATQDWGGAANATRRLLQALKLYNVDATWFTYYKSTKQPYSNRVQNNLNWLEQTWLRAIMTYERHQLSKYQETFSAMWSSNLLLNPMHNIINRQDANLIHMHWIGSGFIPVASLRQLQQPIVWTLHDMWAFTGGCHYAHNCTKYQTHCGNCPLLPAPHPQDASYHAFESKLKHWCDIPMTIVTPSHWLADCARQSPILQDKSIEVIPNPIDTNQFRPIDKQVARDIWDLPQDKKLILFGASNIHSAEKGFPDLQAALAHLHRDDAEFVIFGSGQIDASAFSLPVHHMGHINSHRLLILLYNAVDTLLLSSHMDNLPNTVMEALACGTPAIAYNIGGLPDMIDHQHNGYLAEPFETEELANGINWLLSADPDMLSHNARQKVLDDYSMDVVAQQNIALYERVLKSTS